MLFNSLEFAIFLILVFFVYWALPHRFRPLLLMVSSFYFYGRWNPVYLLLILAMILSSYGCARWIGRLKQRKETTVKRQKLAVFLNCLVCLGLLTWFKYINFLIDSFRALMNAFGAGMSDFMIDVLLPVGISFYTFQTISYVIDVYREKLEPEKDIVRYAAFISFFPQLVAGPIERSTNLLPQLKEEKHFDYDEAVYGMRLMAWGFYKKLVIADVLVVYVDRVYGELHSHTGVDLLITSFFFMIMIYCDFSGYSDIAIGTARLFGIKLMKNFNSPFLSHSNEEMWRRWHISLSTWFRDYVYIPLGGNRKGRIRKYINIVVTFFLSGLWHGAAWHFVVWGTMQGVVQVFEDIGRKTLTTLKKNRIFFVCSVIFTTVFFQVSVVFFRAPSVSDAFYLLGHMFDGFGSAGYFTNHMLLWPLPAFIIAVSILILFAYDLASLKTDVIAWVGTRPKLLRWAISLGILMMIILFKASDRTEFVYFQF
ncbi:MAG: MBOAT family protein [Lachnospiraceae bacterium]|nr:MBOAT family protein [Lachnospiraceae bacterium]